MIQKIIPITVTLGIVLISQICTHTAIAIERQEEGYIGGLIPNQRPDHAPVLTTIVKNDDWYKKALTGIEPPYPWSLRFLEDQGNWYTPFNHPGMLGRYDIRGWHKR